jgi:hypothetical protein
MMGTGTVRDSQSVTAMSDRSSARKVLDAVRRSCGSAGVGVMR